MDAIIIVIVALAAGFLIGYLISTVKRKGTEERCKMLSSKIEELKEESEKNIQRERESAKVLKDESEKNWNAKFATLQETLKNLAAEQLSEKQKELGEYNQTTFKELLKPVKEKFEEFKKSVDDSKTQNTESKSKIEETFKNTLALFQQAQDKAIKDLKEQTDKIGDDAKNLTKALKSESKTQGNWGEMILETLLENSGLRKDEEYYLQETVKTEEGKSLRPDVIIRLPEARSIVIDSKVSLTSYADAVVAETEEERNNLLKAHVKSMKEHVDELAAKKYDEYVKDHIGYVLMFVPNESSYICAMQFDPNLSQYAYNKHVIIISPANLMMALQLAYNLWQGERQNKSVQKIITSAAALYDKVAGFQETFDKIEKQIKGLTESYETAKNQLSTGRGNILRRVEYFKEMGITPKNQIKNPEELHYDSFEELTE